MIAPNPGEIISVGMPCKVKEPVASVIVTLIRRSGVFSPATPAKASTSGTTYAFTKSCSIAVWFSRNPMSPVIVTSPSLASRSKFTGEYVTFLTSSSAGSGQGSNGTHPKSSPPAELDC